MTSKDALAALLREQLKKDPVLAAKQRRLLDALGLTEQNDQQRVADADTAKVAAMRGDSKS